MSTDILYDRHGNVRLITINRPESMNALDFQASGSLVEIWKTFNADADARVAVITGAGNKAFCAGADLKTYTMNFATRPAPEFRREFTNGPGFAGITRNMEIYKPVVAAVNGYSISGGFELALACDIRFCSPNAEFALQDVRWGFHPCDGALVRLPQIVGLGHAMEIFLSGERIGAENAYRMGLVNRIHPQDKLVEETLAYAELLAKRAPLAQQLGKEVMLRAYGQAMEEALRMESASFHNLGRSEDLAEGTTAFREKREAEFKGR